MLASSGPHVPRSVIGVAMTFWSATFVGALFLFLETNSWAVEGPLRSSVRIKTETDVVYGDQSEPMHRADLFYPSVVLPQEKSGPSF